MKTTTIQLYSLDYKEVKTYLTASLFIAGNMVLPQLFHIASQGGTTWLPIYFFTLIGAYKYGWKVGLLTAVSSPILELPVFRDAARGILTSNTSEIRTTGYRRRVCRPTFQTNLYTHSRVCCPLLPNSGHPRRMGNHR